MSYRNPPIIVDRSTDVWGKAIANFGQQVSQGIISASEAYEKSQAAQAAQSRRDSAAMQKLSTRSRESYMGVARDSYIAIKKRDSNIANQFMEQTMKDLDGDGEKIGAIDAGVQIELNTNLTPDQKKEYQEVVDNAKMYQSQAVDAMGKVITGIEGVREKSQQKLGQSGGWTFRGNDNFERLKNQLAYYAVDTDEMINDKVKESRKISRGEKGENFLEATTLVPVDQFREGGDFAGQLTSDQEEGMESVFEDEQEYYKFSFKRDANEWDGEFTTDIPDAPNYSEVYKEAGIEDKKGVINQKLTGQIEITTDDYEDQEELIDIGAIRNNEGLNDIMLGKASAIVDGNDASIQAFLNFALGKGGMTIKEFNKTYPTSEGRVDHIKNLLIDDSIEKKFLNKYSTRKATEGDVVRLNSFNPASTVSVDDDILFKNTGSKKVNPEDTKKPTEGEIRRGQAVEQAKTVFNDIFNQPEAYFKNKKIGGENIVDVKIIDIPASDSGTGKGADAKASKILELKFVSGSSIVKGEKTEFTDTMKFDLNDPVRVRALINSIPGNDDLKRELKNLISSNPLLKIK